MNKLQDNDLTAYFTAATKKCPAGVSIYRFDADRGRQCLLLARKTEGKVAARAFAKAMNATPWNF